jgi:predicted type IV restriction endonuclease
MAAINQKVIDRITAGLKKFQPLVEAAKIRDINESDTVVLLTGILSDILGYDKYTEITTEKAVKPGYCDLAITLKDKKIEMYIEAKAIGKDLNDNHVQQAIGYATFGGTDWAILTNAVNWRLYKIVWGKPITTQLALEFNFLELKAKSKEDIEKIALLCKECYVKDSLDDFYTQRQATSKYMLGNLIFEDAVINSIKKELKEVYPDLKCTNEEIYKIIHNEVVKREIIEGDEATEAQKKIAKANKRVEKIKAEKNKVVGVAPLDEPQGQVQTES